MRCWRTRYASATPKFGLLFRWEGDAFCAVAQHVDSPYAESWRQPLVIRDHPGLPLARVAATKGVAHIVNVTEEQAYIDRDPRMITLIEDAGVASSASRESLAAARE